LQNELLKSYNHVERIIGIVSSITIIWQLRSFSHCS
jgi:hypothetical protein